MAPIPRDSHWDEKSTATEVHGLPLHKHSAGPTPSSSPKISARKLIASIFLFLASISLLHKPMRHCYHRAHEHFCPYSKLSVEQRARKVLSTTPLIGESALSASMLRSHTATNHLVTRWPH